MLEIRGSRSAKTAKERLAAVKPRESASRGLSFVGAVTNFSPERVSIGKESTSRVNVDSAALLRMPRIGSRGGPITSSTALKIETGYWEE
ncbi:hypothetical protein [Micromonospora globbae]|uniref:hypothetical protein n=1 Tax=Micromonospora globbae TaxID=1894969 RepID=UPI0011C37971|nr:hypothetical protein [Micromonospora globbae]